MPKRVLIVEDEGMLALLVEDLVADYGGVVAASVSSAAAALAAVRTQDLDLALLDVNLGEGETSFAVAEVLRAQGVAFAFLTGYGPQGVPAEYRDVPILGKPVDPEALRRLVEDAN